MCLGTMIWSLTHTESKPKASTCCASRRMFCMVAACPRLGRLKPNSIRPLLLARDGVVMLAVVADLLDQSKSSVGLVAPGKVGYTGQYVSRACSRHLCGNQQEDSSRSPMERG